MNSCKISQAVCSKAMPNRLLKMNILLTSGFISLMMIAGIFHLGAAEAKQSGYNFANSSGLTTAGNVAGYETAEPTTVDQLIGQIIQIALSFLGAVFLIFAVYGGFTWMTAHGNETKVTKAKEIILSSLIGMVITLAAYGISIFVIDALWKY